MQWEEAISDEEKKIFKDCLEKIKIELQRPIDKFSRKLIAMNIELLLNYCMRFYARQFVTREVTNKDVVGRFEALLDDYFTGNKPHQEGLPSVKYFADKFCLSSHDPLICIARKLGYHSLQSFSATFKRVVGCSPSDYRNMN